MTADYQKPLERWQRRSLEGLEVSRHLLSHFYPQNRTLLVYRGKMDSRVDPTPPGFRSDCVVAVESSCQTRHVAVRH